MQINTKIQKYPSIIVYDYNILKSMKKISTFTIHRALPKSIFIIFLRYGIVSKIMTYKLTFRYVLRKYPVQRGCLFYLLDMYITAKAIT